jgi:hypothetical protein
MGRPGSASRLSAGRDTEPAGAGRERFELMIHVRYGQARGWMVHPDDREEPSSEHPTADAAARAAIAYAAALDRAACVVIHDRYERLHSVLS